MKRLRSKYPNAGKMLLMKESEFERAITYTIEVVCEKLLIN